MVFVPGEKLLRTLNSEKAGLWFIKADNEDKASVLAKLPTTTIKSIYLGCKCTLILSAVEMDGYRIRFIALRVDDSSDSPFCTSQPSVESSEIMYSNEILSNSTTYIHFFDERSRSVLTSTIRMNISESTRALRKIIGLGPSYIGPLIPQINKAHNIFQEELELTFIGKRRTKRKIEISYIPIEVKTNHVVSIAEVNKGEFILNDIDEGDAFEQTIHGSFANIYSDNNFRSPQIKKGVNYRELSDLLGFDSKSICIVESKALSILNKSPLIAKFRRKQSIKKDINKGFSQLRGVIRKLKSGDDIFDSRFNKINIPNRNNLVVHAIILISEMFPFLNWKEIAKKIVAFSDRDIFIFFHVLDLKELQYLIIHSQNSLIFGHNLSNLNNKIRNSGTALVSFVNSPYQ